MFDIIAEFLFDAIGELFESGADAAAEAASAAAGTAAEAGAEVGAEQAVAFTAPVDPGSFSGIGDIASSQPPLRPVSPILGITQM